METQPPAKKNRPSVMQLSKPAPPQPLAKGIDPATEQWKKLNASVATLRGRHNARSKRVEQLEANTAELSSLTQSITISLRLGRPLEGTLSDIQAAQELLKSKSQFVSVDCADDASLRHAGFRSNIFSHAVSHCLMGHFLQHGSLLPFRGTETSTDCFSHLLPSEYLIGVMYFTKLVEHYAIGRAIAGDQSSIDICRRLIDAILHELLQFDFRNGPLRRNYDGVKYVNKRLQEISYDLSLVCEKVDEEASKEGVELEGSQLEEATIVRADDFAAIKAQIAAADLARDNVIKQCRDTQKAAKNAIFALHRGEDSYEKADKMIADSACNGIRIYSEVMGTYKENRYRGSFPSAMEEWAEAALFSHWLKTKTVLSFDELENLFNKSLIDTGVPKSDPRWVEGTIAEYVGGLVDLTGEIGRWAIAQATKRDIAAVTKVNDVLHRSLPFRVPLWLTVFR